MSHILYASIYQFIFRKKNDIPLESSILFEQIFKICPLHGKYLSNIPILIIKITGSLVTVTMWISIYFITYPVASSTVILTQIENVPSRPTFSSGRCGCLLWHDHNLAGCEIKRVI